jgi:predicted HicB family RNase H-like nuclease
LKRKVRLEMTRTVTAEYLAEENVLKLDEPLEGVRNHERVSVVLHAEPATEPSLEDLRGALSEESGRAVAKAIREGFGRIEGGPRMLTNLPAYSMRLFWSERDNAFIAVCPELHDLSAFGATQEEAARQLREAIALAVEVMEEDGDPLPPPRTTPKYSGQFRLRLSPRLHGDLAAAAEEEGVSLNTLANQILSDAIGQRRGVSTVTSQLTLAMRELWTCVGAFRTAVADLNQRGSSSATPTPQKVSASNVSTAGVWSRRTIAARV